MKSHLLTDELKERIRLDTNGKPSRKSIKEFLQQGDASPVNFELFKASDFTMWLTALEEENGGFHSFSTYSSHRSAFFHLFITYGQTVPSELSKDINQYLKKLKRGIAAEITSGQVQIKSGKDPLHMTFYRYVALVFLKENTKDYLFARTFMIMCWNLMLRAGNCFSICYDHLEWIEDSLSVYFAQMKNDQGGDKPRRGIEKEDLGTHSMRKGAATYCSSGSTACSPSTAIHLRAGWALGGVQDRYMRYESAGDMYVGRTVSGLPIEEPEFAVLPPRFKPCEAVSRAMKLCFPNIPRKLNFVGQFALASIVCHKEFLLRTLYKTHPVIRSPLFRSPRLLK
jgi:hypothetical protein